MRKMRNRPAILSAMLQISPLTAFTVIAVLGYLFFVVPPGGPANLAWIASLDGFDWIPAFYGASFNFFAQAHILIGALVLAVFLFKRSGLSWLAPFAAVYAISMGSELLGTSTGLPFGEYSYTSLLGAKFLGLVPLLIPVSWFLMSLPAFLIAADRFRSKVARILFGASLLTVWDLALDPAMSFITTYWTWAEVGSYYGMPLINLVGWFGTGAVLMLALDATGMRKMAGATTTAWMWVYYLVTLALPVGMIAAAGLWPAVVLTVVAVAALFLVWTRRASLKTTAHVEDVAGESTATLAALDALPLDLQVYFEHHSRSFSFAARFFSRAERERVSRLYAFCRITDDLVDEHIDVGESGPTAREVLQSWKTIAYSSFNGKQSGVEWLDTLMSETRTSGAGFDLVQALFDGVESDLEEVRFQTEKELDQYAYRVGSVVGVWMCHLLGVKSETMHGYAAALGSAMQLTNILRDVGEDLESGRIYLPASLMNRFGITEADLWNIKESGRPTDAYAALVRYLMATADDRYDHAWTGLVHLPRTFGLAGAVASGVYRGIHREIVLNGFDNLTKRARTSGLQKLRLAMKAWTRLRSARRHPAHGLDTAEVAPPNRKLARSVRSVADEYHA